jgi:hypothetical protein
MSGSFLGISSLRSPISSGGTVASDMSPPRVTQAVGDTGPSIGLPRRPTPVALALHSMQWPTMVSDSCQSLCLRVGGSVGVTTLKPRYHLTQWPQHLVCRGWLPYSGNIQFQFYILLICAALCRPYA